jgi:hypothetical protein
LHLVIAHTTAGVSLKVGSNSWAMEAKSLPGKRKKTLNSFWGAVVQDLS